MLGQKLLSLSGTIVSLVGAANFQQVQGGTVDTLLRIDSAFKREDCIRTDSVYFKLVWRKETRHFGYKIHYAPSFTDRIDRNEFLVQSEGAINLADTQLVIPLKDSQLHAFKLFGAVGYTDNNTQVIWDSIGC